MINKTKSSIEAIYPLSYMQQGLLLHHLSSKFDQGFLNIECTLIGDFNLTLFKESCMLISQRHDVLRSTIHWKKLENPLHVVHKSKYFQIDYLDWLSLGEKEKNTNWVKLKENALKAGSNLEAGALLHITIARFSKNQYHLLWPMHHILLDGWSGSIIIKDLFSIYDALYHTKTPKLDSIPSFKSYLKWVNQQSEEHAITFWESYLEAYKSALLFGDNQIKNTLEETYLTQSFELSEEDSNQLKNYCKKNIITVNTFIQSVWSLLLIKYFGKNDIIHGTTVSGRAGDFPNIDLLSGMFMNVQPVRGRIDENIDLSTWFRSMQKLQFEARNYEYLSLDKLYEYINWSDNTALFDSLIVFENYPTVKNDKTILKVSNIKSGLTSTYPVTLAILPKNETKFVLTTSSKNVDSKTATWIINTLKNIIEIIVSEDVTNLKALNTKIKPIKNIVSLNKTQESITNDLAYIAPKNKTELKLVQIWENILGINKISTGANFFELGGKSLVAVKMFSIINKTFKTKLSATALLEHSTIEKLSKYITSGSQTDSLWKYTIPIKVTGNKSPLFCIHGGGGYVIFFNPLVNALHKSIPVYALQPAGLTNNEQMHESIEKMASDYAKEIKNVQPNGPYNLLTYCFSPAVGIEIANIFKSQGEVTNLVVIDSIIKQEDFTDPDRIKMRIYGFINRLISNPFSAIKLMTINNYRRFLEPSIIKLFASESKKNLYKITRNLVKIYINYGWDKKHPDDVLLILTEKADKNLNPTYIKSWEGITKGNLDIKYTTGKHHELFNSPHVDSIANLIEKSLYKT